MGKGFFFNVIMLSTLAGTHQLLGGVDEDNILGVSVQNIKRNTEALVVASREIRLEGNAKKLSTRSCLGTRTQEKLTTKTRINSSIT
jgi:hypothetical protein